MIKRAAAMHDLSGLGHCSLSAAMAVLPAQGIQCCPVPTCVLSTQTDGYTDYSFCDLTQALDAYLEHWISLHERFDAVYTGYLGTQMQLGAARRLISQLKAEDGLALVDPVMGDDGILYDAVSRQMPERMRSLISCADVITPNLTEACLLTGRQYSEMSPEQAMNLACELAGFGPEQVVISGIFSGDTVAMACFDRGRTCYIEKPRAAQSYPGSGDVFASVVLGRLLRGSAFFSAVEEAADFVYRCAAACAEEGAVRREGLVFEPQLYRLMPRKALD
jgi:pyridoxine kinase